MRNSFTPGDLARGLDQWRECTQGFSDSEKRMLQKLCRVGSFLSIDFKRLGKVVAEHRRQVLWIGNRRCAVRGDQVQSLEGILIEIRGFTLNHLCMTGHVYNDSDREL